MAGKFMMSTGEGGRGGGGRGGGSGYYRPLVKFKRLPLGLPLVNSKLL
jgi:hypothetical protein